MITRLTRTSSIRKERTGINLMSMYKNYTLANSKEQIYWYMKGIILIPCLFMVPAITLMHAVLPDHYIWFVALSMALFFLNLIVHMSQCKSNIYIPTYHLSVLIIVLIPMISYYINGL